MNGEDETESDGELREQLRRLRIVPDAVMKTLCGQQCNDPRSHLRSVRHGCVKMPCGQRLDDPRSQLRSARNVGVQIEAGGLPDGGQRQCGPAALCQGR